MAYREIKKDQIFLSKKNRKEENTESLKRKKKAADELSSVMIALFWIFLLFLFAWFN